MRLSETLGEVSEITPLFYIWDRPYCSHERLVQKCADAGSLSQPPAFELVTIIKVLKFGGVPQLNVALF